MTGNGFFLRDNFALEPLCPLPGDAESTVNSFATDGQLVAVGRSIDRNGKERPVQWVFCVSSFVVIPIPLPVGSTQGYVYSADHASRLAGDVEVGGHRVPAYWPNASSLPILFPLSGTGQGLRIRDMSGEPIIAGVHAGLPRRSSGLVRADGASDGELDGERRQYCGAGAGQ